ncbi:hypothetical protein [Flavobacterium sp. N3904]|uniref:hypothetical protein n=1 Tax=Flavobacterium sp. N3904 TaxID=2986835 RepID=UPI002224BD76|nr:hypothetical protein [Flavobacterium sp. N3904]
MRRISIIIMGLALFLSLGSAKPISFIDDTNLIIIDRIEIEIQGTSTVGKYNCSNAFNKRDTIFINSSVQNNLKAEIAMNNFDCGNRIMNKDLKTTIMVDKFPKSYVTISNIKPFATNYKCNLNFLITNKNVKYKDFVLKNSKESLEGTIGLKFSELELVPPTKMGGLIKVKDDIIVNFILYKKK